MRDKNTSARLCAKNAEGAYAQGGEYLWGTMVYALNVRAAVDGSVCEDSHTEHV